MRARAHARVAEATRWVTVAVLSALGFIAVIGNELRSQDVDPQYARVIVDRTIRYGGSFYENGIHNKGPLEPFVYAVASWFTTYDGFWFAISTFVALAAFCVAYVSAWAARFTGASKELSLAAGVVVFVHLTLSSADYAGVLYAWNMVVCLLAAAWILAMADRAWTTPRRRTASAAVIGACLGLGVQTLVSTALIGAILLVAALAMTAVRVSDNEQRRRLSLTTLGAAAAAFGSAPLYYAVRGGWGEFWSGWWVQARYMNVGTGRSLGSQLSLGLHQFGEYYQRRPLAFLIVTGFALITIVGWRDGDTRSRVFHGGLLAWFVAAWIELALSQRYSSHYFVVTTVPTALMGAAIIGHAYRTLMITRRRRIPGAVAWPLIASVLAVYLSGTNATMDALRVASSIRTPQSTEIDRERNIGGEERAVWAVLDLVSLKGDALLTWSNDPWPYLKYHRVAASRFIWKSFLMGEIYLGRTSKEYVLPHAWTWFAQDVARSRPVAFIETNPRDEGTPFDALITNRFAPVMATGRNTVYLRNDVASDVLRSGSTAPWLPPTAGPDTGWIIDGDRAVSENPQSEPLLVATQSCVRIDGVITTGADGRLRFRFTDNTGRTEPLHLTLDSKRVAAGSDFVEYLGLPSATDGGPEGFSLVIGRRAAALIVGGRIRGALRLPPSVSVGAIASGGPVELRDLRTGSVSPRSGCSAQVRQVS